MRPDEFWSTVNGIPCKVVVTAFSAPVPSNPNVDPLDDPRDEGQFTFRVFTEDGEPAGWLEDMVTPDDVDKFYREYTGE